MAVHHYYPTLHEVCPHAQLFKAGANQQAALIRSLEGE